VSDKKNYISKFDNFAPPFTQFHTRAHQRSDGNNN